MGDEREPVNGESPIHQIGSCFVWKWRPKRNQNIIIFPKKCVYKLKKIYLYKLKFLKNYTGIGPRTYPNIPKQLVAPGREGCGDPRPCTSRERLVTIPKCSNGCSRGLLFVGFSMTEKCKSPLCEDSSGQKRNLVL